jgi:hypothetical protein
MNPAAPAFIQLVRSPFKFRLFLLTKLPAAFFSGVRVREISEQHCIATVPFKWLTQNPFRSTYFASLSMAAELTTGALGQMQVFRRTPPVSMLVVKVDSSYFKKATGRTRFECRDGALFASAVADAIQSGEARTVTARSQGTNEAGEMVAEFYITWSFRVKK